MLSHSGLNPAEAAAAQALDILYQCIESRQHFRLEAGAGAGKTYSLIKAMQRLLEQRGNELMRRSQKIACITFTRVARDEIESRLERHPAACPDTIHSFCWSIIKNFQSNLRTLLPQLPKWGVAIEEVGGLGVRRIDYDLGYMRIKDKEVSIRHDDVIELTALLLQNEKFRHLLKARYPIVFIDEYQDTNARFVDALKKSFLDPNDGPLFGFFGDHWQRIYGENACGRIEHPNVVTIGKQSNFRSASAIVACLNRMRPELTQQVSDPDFKGQVVVYHTNSWIGTRRDGSRGGHWRGDTPEDISRAYLSLVRNELSTLGWDFHPAKTKILMLTHNTLAKEQGYPNLMQLYSGRNEQLLNKEDPYFGFFSNTLEPLCSAYEQQKYGDMFNILNQDIPPIRSKAAKLQWSKFMDGLLLCRNGASIGDVIDYVCRSNCMRLPEAIDEKENLLRQANALDDEKLNRFRQLRTIAYTEVIRLHEFIEGYTPFATKHGVKGAEFENVLVVVGRGWNQYDFDQMLTMVAGTNIPPERQDMFERNRNLFYVACSRPRARLALLFTQVLSETAMQTLSNWFGRHAIVALPAAVS